VNGLSVIEQNHSKISSGFLDIGLFPDPSVGLHLSSQGTVDGSQDPLFLDGCSVGPPSGVLEVSTELHEINFIISVLRDSIE